MANQYNGTHVAGAGTTVISTTGGVLHTIVVNGKGTLCTVTDTTPTPVTKAILDTSALGTYTYDMEVSAGIQVVTTGAGTDITVTWI